jgi:hypothetical protein
LKHFQLALLQRGVSTLPVDLPHLAHVRPTVIPTNLAIDLVTGTRAVPLATTLTGGEETIITATTDDMTPDTTSLIGGTMTTEGTMTATVTATVHAIMTTTDAATVETGTEIETESAAVTMKSGITTVDVTNATTMIATVDATARHADVPGAEGETTDRGRPGVVRVSSLTALHEFDRAH